MIKDWPIFITLAIAACIGSVACIEELYRHRMISSRPSPIILTAVIVLVEVVGLAWLVTHV